MSALRQHRRANERSQVRRYGPLSPSLKLYPHFEHTVSGTGLPPIASGPQFGPIAYGDLPHRGQAITKLRKAWSASATLKQNRALLSVAIQNHIMLAKARIMGTDSAHEYARTRTMPRIIADISSVHNQRSRRGYQAATTGAASAWPLWDRAKLALFGMGWVGSCRSGHITGGQRAPSWL